jgi:hypothetical protein
MDMKCTLVFKDGSRLWVDGTFSDRAKPNLDTQTLFGRHEFLSSLDVEPKDAEKLEVYLRCANVASTLDHLAIQSRRRLPGIELANWFAEGAHFIRESGYTTDLGVEEVCSMSGSMLEAKK